MYFQVTFTLQLLPFLFNFNFIIPTFHIHTSFFSDGIGRTGVFITLHAQLERLKIEGIVDVFQFVKSARGQREGLVNSPVSSQQLIPI